MNGRDLQLISRGIQDKVLTGNPEISFFKMIYRKHANFSIESSHVSMDTTHFSFGKTIQCTIPRRGDLMNSVYIQIMVGQKESSLRESIDCVQLGYSLLKYIDIHIGGKQIVRHTGEWLHIWNETRFW